MPHISTGFSPYRQGKKRARSVSEFGMTEFTFENLHESFSTWINFKKSPKELWIVLIAKFFESWCFVTEDFTFMIYFHEDYNLSSYDCGILYTLVAALTFVYGLLISGWIMDNAGCKLSCILGSFFLLLSRLFIPLTSLKSHIFILGTTLYPLGLSLYIPSLTFAIKKTTIGPTRSLAFSLFYASLTLGVFIGGPSIDYFRSNLNGVEISFAGMTTTLSAYGMLYFVGFIMTLACFLLFFFFYKEIDVEEDAGMAERAVVSNGGIC